MNQHIEGAHEVDHVRLKEILDLLADCGYGWREVNTYQGHGGAPIIDLTLVQMPLDTEGQDE